jgi:hypothetical protein
VTARSRLLLVATVGVLVATVVACRPLGGTINRLGNDVAACPQFQPSAACGPQPNVWLAIQGPYEMYANGDPYATKCARNLPSPYNATTCSGAGANPEYRTTGYGYAVDVGPEDVGRALTVRVWDAGSYPRVGSNLRSNASYTSATQLTLPSGSTWPGIGYRIAGEGITPGTAIQSLANSNRTATLTQPLTTPTATRNVAVATQSQVAIDCAVTLPPFNTAPYNGMVGPQQCQTGDAGTAPFQAQLFENDGIDGEEHFDTPIPGCELYVPASPPTTFKNTWTDVCTFTATKTGVYPLRIKSSAITRPNGVVITDTGSGYNTFSLEVAGGATATSTRLYALQELSIWSNTPGSTSQIYLAEITSADAGKRMQLDLFDVGDGASGQYTVQVLAPPSGAPGLVPTGGTAIPAPGYADSCRYNPAPSATRGPDVQGAFGADAGNCTVTTKFASSGSGQYNNSWLSIEIDIAEDYTCDTDCWWTLEYDFGTTSSVPNDRTVWSPLIFDKPATFASVGEPING